MPRRLFRVFCLMLILLCPWGGKSRTDETPMQPRILLLVDGSSSMLQPWNNITRFKAAGKIIAAFMDSIYAVNPNVEFALRVYGHQSPAQINDCFDSRLEVMFSKNNAVQMALRMNSIRPFGVSPIAFSLKEAAMNDLVDEMHNAYSIILITDGGESCGGDICAVVRKLIEQKIMFRPYILGLVNYTPLKDQYACMGSYLSVTNEGEMKPAIQTIVDAYRPILSVPIMPTRTTSVPAQPKPTTQEIPKPAVIPPPSFTPDRSESPRLNALASKTYKSAGLKIPAPQRRPTPSGVGKIYFDAEPVVVDAPKPRTPETVAQIRPKASLRTVNTPPFIATKPSIRSVSYSPPTFVVEPPERRASEAITSVKPVGTIRTVKTPSFQPVAPTKKSIQFAPPSFQLEPPEPVQIAGIQPKLNLYSLKIPVYAPAAPSKRGIQFVPPTYQIEPPEPVQIAGIRAISGMQPLRVPASAPNAPNKRSIQFTPPAFQPEPHEAQQIAQLTPSSTLRTVRISYAHFTMDRRSIPPLPRMPRPEPEPKTDSVVVAKAQPPAKPIPDTAHSSIVVKKLDTPPVLKPKTPAKQVQDGKPKEPTFKTERENDVETSLSILFTDGRGKFYATTPQLQLTDPKSGKIITQFYRTVDAAGNPDPQRVPPGQYNLVVAGRSNMLMRGITVEKDKKNRVIVTVPQGSLRFRYEDAPDRPVTEFEAIVTIRFEPGPTVRQKCTAELEYPPGNYYIEVNTMPISRFNTDIDFGAITEIQIPIPGYVQFTNRTPIGPVSLFTPLGNKFVRFYGMQITGNQAAQRLQLKPGLYEVHWVKNPNLPYASETIEKFLVKSNSVTEVELR